MTTDSLRLHVLAWRDLDASHAGGTERHTHEVVKRWAAAGHDVTVHTSAVSGAAARIRRDGYRVVRTGGKFGSFVRAIAGEVSAGARRPDAVIEVWNGVAFGSPVWFRGAKAVIAHHLHEDLWHEVLPPGISHAGRLFESQLAPRLYRNVPVLVPSRSSRERFIERTPLRPEQVHVVDPGIEERFTPGIRSSHPTVVAAGRMMPLKRFDVLVEQCALARAMVPDLQLVIAGDGPSRPDIQRRAADLDPAGEWVSLPGRVSDAELLRLYQSAWLVASASTNEGWGMTLSEAARCATPAIATRITGHRDAVEDGIAGILVDTDDEIGAAIGALLRDRERRERLGTAAYNRAALMTWDATATEILGVVRTAVSRSGR